MWLIAAFDIPSDDEKAYRSFRKLLLSNGFSRVQKSLYWRWADSRERVESLCKRLSAGVKTGHFLLFQCSERSFRKALQMRDSIPEPLPEVPDPWLIF